jgi:hypothetical protein
MNSLELIELKHSNSKFDCFFFQPNSPRSFRDIDDEVFFDFISGAPGSTQSSLPAIREDDEVDAPR